MVCIMNSLRVDAVALGAHDLDGSAALAARAPHIHAPVLCAPVSRPFRGPFRLLRRRDLRVALIGVALSDLLHTQSVCYTLSLSVRP